jgi:hypothetical protein
MSFDSMFDSDWLRRVDINRLEEKAESIDARLWHERERSDDVRHEVRELRRDVSRILLAVETLQRVLADKGICSGEDFVKRMRAVDAEDGVVDGQFQGPAAEAEELRYCDACQHFNPNPLKACQYCGRSFGPRHPV